MEAERVSVYIPTRDRAELLRRSMRSAIDQSYNNIELIVVNDGSSDETEAVVKCYVEQHPNIIYLKFDEPRGACAARNEAIRASSGRFVTGLDDDDIFLPNRISNLVEAFSEEYSLVASSYFIDNGRRNIKQFTKKEIIRLSDIKIKNYVGNQALTLKSRIQDVHGYDEELVAWQDYDIWFRLIEKYGPAKILQEGTYVVNATSGRERITLTEKSHTGYVQFVKKHGRKLSDKELKCQYVNDLYNRQVKVSIRESFKLCKSWWLFVRLLKLFILTRYSRS